MKRLNLLFVCAVLGTAGFVANAGNSNLDLQKEIIAKQAKIVGNPNLIGPANIKKGVYNPAVNRRGSKDTIIVGLDNPPKGEFLPMYARTAYDFPAKYLIFSRILKNNETGELIPELAVSMPDISKDGKIYTIKLKKNLKFSDGSPLTTKDIAFTYKVMADPSYDGPMSYYVDKIVGYKDYNSGKSEDFKGITVVDDHTIKIEFEEPLVTNLITLNVGIISSKYFAHKKGDLKPVLNKMRKPLGSGPYILKKFAPRQYVELTRNENYWDKKPQIKNVIIKYVNRDVAAQSLAKGEIDMWPEETNPDVISTANRTGFINRNQYLRHGYGYLNINLNDPVMKDKDVRKALLYGLDRNAILQLYYKGLAIPLDTVCSMTWWMYDKDFDKKITHYGFNPAKAKKLLDEAGWKMGTDGYRYKNGQKMTIIWAATKDLDFVDVLMPILLQNWKQLGVDVKVKRLDFNSLMDLLYKERKGYSIANLAVGEDVFPNPRETWHSSQDKPGGNNSPHFRSKKADKLIEKMETDLDKEKYKADWQEFILYMNEEMPRYVLYSNIYTDLYNDRIKNLKTSPLFRWYSYAILDAYIDNGK